MRHHQLRGHTSLVLVLVEAIQKMHRANVFGPFESIDVEYDRVKQAGTAARPYLKLQVSFADGPLCHDFEFAFEQWLRKPLPPGPGRAQQPRHFGCEIRITQFAVAILHALELLRRNRGAHRKFEGGAESIEM